LQFAIHPWFTNLLLSTVTFTDTAATPTVRSRN